MVLKDSNKCKLVFIKILIQNVIKNVLIMAGVTMKKYANVPKDTWDPIAVQHYVILNA